MKIEAKRLFPDGYIESIKRRWTPGDERRMLLARAQQLRELASRGMKPRTYRKEADRLTRLAENL